MRSPEGGRHIGLKILVAATLLAAPGCQPGARGDQSRQLDPGSCITITDQPVLVDNGGGLTPGPNRVPANPNTVCQFKK